uniref:Uncharacterized protein n=1 Tax=Anabas testudineus TaxID=64144 RepID=A0A3Q1HZC0_ANATE
CQLHLTMLLFILMQVTVLKNMNTLLERFHNFILPLVRGEEHVCGCTCGRHQVYHVVPYYGADAAVDSREHCFLSNFLSHQEMDLITGLLLGLCITWFLLWLEGLWHSGLQYWRSNRQHTQSFSSYILYSIFYKELGSNHCKRHRHRMSAVISKTHGRQTECCSE